VAPIIEKVFVKASGWKSLPSCPVSAKTGRKARIDDCEREEDRPADQARGLEHRLGHAAAIARIHPALLDEPERVLRDYDAGVHQHADGNRDPGQRHDVGGDAEVAEDPLLGADSTTLWRSMGATSWVIPG
jgi:hypothetical protein